MAKIFYDHLVMMEEIIVVIDQHDLSPKERQELISLVDQTLHHHILDVILAAVSGLAVLCGVLLAYHIVVELPRRCAEGRARRRILPSHPIHHKENTPMTRLLVALGLSLAVPAAAAPGRATTDCPSGVLSTCRSGRSRCFCCTRCGVSRARSAA